MSLYLCCTVSMYHFYGDVPVYTHSWFYGLLCAYSTMHSLHFSWSAEACRQNLLAAVCRKDNALSVLLMWQARVDLAQTAAHDWSLAVAWLTAVPSLGAASFKKSLQLDLRAVGTVSQLDNAVGLPAW